MNDTEKTREDLKEDATKNDQGFPFRIDWYQTDTDVIVNMFRKRENQNDKYDVIFTENTVRLTTTTNGRSYTKEVQLEKSIDPARSTWEVFVSKIEIKMRKTDSSKWANYEATEKTGAKPKSKNWDEFVNKIEEDKLEGEALLNKFFGDIYNRGSDAVKRAMIKSFYESGGTELNTDWEKVSDRRVDIKPPEGMEWKLWDK